MSTAGEASTPTFHDLRIHAMADPHRTAVVCGERRTSYGELEALANRLANLWRGLGLQRGEHVATLLGNRAEAFACAWAAWRCGLYLTPLNTTLTAHELRALVDDCDARAVICDAAYASVAAELPAASKPGVHWHSLGGAIAGHAAVAPLLAAASSAPTDHEPPGALMLYTSGTTGMPKGVVRPLLPAEFRGTPAFAADLLPIFGLAGSDVRYLSPAPLYHAAPLRFSLAVTAGGGTVHLMQRFDAEAALAALERERITHSQWVPAMLQRLLALPAARREAFAAPAHRCAIHAAAPCPPSVKRAMIDWWGPILLEYYAGSEGVGMTLIDSQEWLAHPGSVGRAVRGTLHIAGPSGEALGADETGLVCFSGLPHFAYHKAPEKTAARTTSQGWQTLGDIGHADAEGWLYLTDRSDDMLISGGVNVYPQEIEAAIREVPGVWDCAVVGIADERFGERPVAFVVAQPDAGDAAGLPARVGAHCAERLGRVKRPDAIHLIAELPRSATGKLLRKVLREALPRGDR